MNVLVVMSDTDRGERLKQFLSQEGHNVTLASKPRQGLAEAKQEPPHCVISEQDDGVSALADFRSGLASQCPDVPVLIFEPSDSWRSIMEAVGTVHGVTNEDLIELSRSPLTEAKPERDVFGVRLPTILLLDGDHTARRQLAAHLADEGWRVLETENLQQAALALLDEKIDCLAVGTIQSMSHLEVIASSKKIREAHPHPFCILALTDSEDRDTLKQAIRDGADEVVTRTIDRSMFAWRARVAVRAHHQRDEIRRLKERLALPSPTT